MHLSASILAKEVRLRTPLCKDDTKGSCSRSYWWHSFCVSKVVLTRWPRVIRLQPPLQEVCGQKTTYMTHHHQSHIQDIAQAFRRHPMQRWTLWRSRTPSRPLNDGQTRQRMGESQKIRPPDCCFRMLHILHGPTAVLGLPAVAGLELAQIGESSTTHCSSTTSQMHVGTPVPPSRCTIPLPGHLATILHTLSFYDLWYQIKMADRGPYGLHLDFLMNLNDVVTLMDLFSAESTLNFQQQVWDFEESIYQALKTEVYGLPKVPYDRRDLPTHVLCILCENLQPVGHAWTWWTITARSVSSSVIGLWPA